MGEHITDCCHLFSSPVVTGFAFALPGLDLDAHEFDLDQLREALAYHRVSMVIDWHRWCELSITIHGLCECTSLHTPCRLADGVRMRLALLARRHLT